MFWILSNTAELVVQKSAPHYTEAAYDEIELLAEAAKNRTAAEWTASMQERREAFGESFTFAEDHTGVVQLADYFEHDSPNGRHICMMFEPMGPNVLSVIKK